MRGWRIAAWAAAPILLLLPLIAMRFTGEVVWDAADFVLFGALLVAAGVTFEWQRGSNGEVPIGSQSPLRSRRHFCFYG